MSKHWIITDNNRHSLGGFSTKKKALEFATKQQAFDFFPLWLEKLSDSGEYIKQGKI